MSWGKAFKAAYQELHVPWRFVLLMYVLFLAAAFYPSEPGSNEVACPAVQTSCILAHGMDEYGRYINTAVQVGVPLLLGDKVGMAQLAYVAVVTTVATHGMKRLVNDWEVDGTRMGERPYSPTSSHNIPSGHSSMASCAAFFVMRRYGWRFGLTLVVIMLLSMFARVALDAHTVSAVLSGACLGFATAALCTSRYTGEQGLRGATARSIKDRFQSLRQLVLRNLAGSVFAGAVVASLLAVTAAAVHQAEQASAAHLAAKSQAQQARDEAAEATAAQVQAAANHAAQTEAAQALSRAALSQARTARDAALLQSEQAKARALRAEGRAQQALEELRAAQGLP